MCQGLTMQIARNEMLHAKARKADADNRRLHTRQMTTQLNEWSKANIPQSSDTQIEILTFGGMLSESRQMRPPLSMLGW